MIQTKVVITNRDDILGSVILALATRCAGKHIAGGATKEYLKENGFFILRFANENQVVKLRNLMHDYVPVPMQDFISVTIEPN